LLSEARKRIKTNKRINSEKRKEEKRKIFPIFKEAQLTNEGFFSIVRDLEHMKKRWIDRHLNYTRREI
tara:strand:+ start:861 stop:1064 length:204 start_codon:yes stop_codon:yes gene_type:complete